MDVVVEVDERVAVDVVADERVLMVDVVVENVVAVALAFAVDFVSSLVHIVALIFHHPYLNPYPLTFDE